MKHISITEAVGRKILGFISGQENQKAKRSEILDHIGQESKTIGPFDRWAKMNLKSFGGGMYGIKPLLEGGNMTEVLAGTRTRTVMSSAELAALATSLAEDLFLRDCPLYTEDEIRLAAARRDITALPKTQLVNKMRPYVTEQWANLKSQLLFPQAVVVEKTVPVPLGSFELVDLIREVLQRLPNLAPTIASLYTSVPANAATYLPEVKSLLTPVRTEKVYIVVIGLLSKQQNDFLSRPAVKTVLEENKHVELMFVDSQMNLRTAPAKANHAFLMHRVQAMKKSLTKAYGTENVSIFSGLVNLEHSVVSFIRSNH